MIRSRAQQRGMSLIELLAVVVIIGVLAVLAYVGFRKWFGSSRLSEATNLVGEIRRAQEHRKSETGGYLDVSKGSDVPFMYPAATPGKFATKWGAVCTVCNAGVDWADLNIQVNEPVVFGYATVAGNAQCAPNSCKGVAIPMNGKNVDFNARAGGAVNGPWYVVVAKGDSNGNSIFATVVGDSFSNDLLIDQEGE